MRGDFSLSIQRRYSTTIRAAMIRMTWTLLLLMLLAYVFTKGPIFAPLQPATRWRLTRVPVTFQGAANKAVNNSVISVAVIVRTHPGQVTSLPITLGSLSLACRAVQGKVSLQVVLMNTDSQHWQELTYMHQAIQTSVQWLKDCPRSSMEVMQFTETPWEGAYGYDYTQHALEHLLYGCRLVGNRCTPPDAASQRMSRQPDYLMFTNGDNLFNVATFKAVVPHMEKQIDVIAFHFVSHHGRDNVKNVVIQTVFKTEFIDLSSAFYRAARLVAVGNRVANFVPHGKTTSQMFVRDGLFAEGIVNATVNGANTSTIIVPQVLLFHQRK